MVDSSYCMCTQLHMCQHMQIHTHICIVQTGTHKNVHTKNVDTREDCVSFLQKKWCYDCYQYKYLSEIRPPNKHGSNSGTRTVTHIVLLPVVTFFGEFLY